MSQFPRNNRHFAFTRRRHSKVGLLVPTVSFLFVCALLAVLLSPGVESKQKPTAEMQLSPTTMREIAALIAEKKSRTPNQRKIDSHLLAAEKIRRGQPVAEGITTISTGIETDHAGRVLVDISALVSDELIKHIEAVGGEVVNSFPDYNAIRALVPLSQIEGLAGSSSIKFIHPASRGEFNTARQLQSGLRSKPEIATSRLTPSRPVRNSGRQSQSPDGIVEIRPQQASNGPLAPAIGSVTSQGDRTHQADSARLTYGVDGTGVRIGVISDSIDHLAASQASGNLGTIFVLSGQSGINTCGDSPCSGEGTAMLEIVHDLAPGAQLFFATANGGPAAFAQNIRNLRYVAHCDIIVDDFLDAIETPFQDGQVTPSDTNGGAALQAVNEVTADGAVYFSSAGNSGNLSDGTSGVWEGDFVDGGSLTIDGEPVGRLHSFGPSVYNTQTGTASDRQHSQAGVTLFWSDPLGASGNDYDFYVLDAAGTVIDRGDNPQQGFQDPYEEGQLGLLAGDRIVITKFSGAGRFLHLGTARGRLSLATAGQVRGHSCAAAAFSVAATPAFSPLGGDFSNPFGPYPNPFNSFNLSERFSSDGPRRMFFTASGAAFTPGNVSSTGGIVRITPDITAADGVITSLPFGEGLNPFFGTSAAAPHAAAIAALLKSFRPSLTPAQIRTALTSTAVDIETPGVDRVTGVGIVMADRALQSVTVSNLTPLQPPGWSDRIVVSNTSGTSIDSSPLRSTDPLFVDWAVLNDGVTTTGLSFDIRLFVDGVPRNTWTSNPLNSNFYVYVQDYSIGSLSVGTHTIRIVADITGAIAETNESDNEYTKTITVSAPVANTFQFSATNFNVNEASSSLAVTVTRAGSTASAATVDYATSDGTATQSRDYTLAAGRLSFAAGETSKTFTLLITDDLFVEPNETINVALSNPSAGLTVGSPSAATVTITNNDSGTPATNPLDNADARFFVRQHYSDFLSRNPDASGYDYWSGQITQCGSNVSCRRTTFTDVSNAFYFEQEFQQTGSYVYRLYRAAFGNNQPFPNPIPDPTHPGEEKKFPLYTPFMRDRAQVRGGSQLAQLQLDLANAFVQRSEFTAKYPASLSAAGFVDAVLATITNDTGANLTAQRTALINLFNSSGRGSVLYRLADDNLTTNPINNRAFIDIEYNRAFVFTQYAGYLRRNADMAGLLFWLGQVNSAPLRNVAKQHAMVCAFITSSEYQQRFSSLVTRSNAECQ